MRCSKVHGDALRCPKIQSNVDGPQRDKESEGLCHEACWVVMNSIINGDLNIAKGTTDPRVKFILLKLLLEVVPKVQTKILNAFLLQNLD